MNKVYTFGSIVDICEPFLSQTYNDDKTGSYVTKIKIVDNTFNQNTTIDNSAIKFQKYAIINIYSISPTEAPKIQNVGDIIRLRRFLFQINSLGELVGYDNSFSNWMIYDGKVGGDLIPKSMKNIAANNDKRQPHDYEKERIEKLRKWNNSFFGENSLRTILWWSKLIEPNAPSKDFSEEQKSRDMILKVINVNIENKTIVFADESKIEYNLFLTSAPLIKKGQVVKLRNCHVLFEGAKRTLILSNNSSCLIIPSNFFDYRMFEEAFYQEHKNIIYRSPKIKTKSTKENYLTRGTLLEKWPTLKDYYIEEHLIAKKELVEDPPYTYIASRVPTLIKKEYDNRIPLNLMDLINMTDNEKSDMLYQKFVISANIVEMSKLTSDSIYQYFKTSNSVYPLKYDKTMEIKEKPIFVVCLKLLLTDHSTEDQDIKVPVYIATKNPDTDPFILWKILPSCSDYKNWPNTVREETVKKFTTKLEALKHIRSHLKLVVELKKTEKKQYFFNVVDTLFLP